MKHRHLAGAALAFACHAPVAPAADYPCAHTWEQLSHAVQDAVTPAYRDEAHADLTALTNTLAGFQAEAGECQSQAQDHANDAASKQRDIAEWRSLNEWLYRLTSFVDQNARGDHSMDWKREFETFAEVYELRL